MAGRAKPNIYFSLVQQFLDAVPRINAMKRSACIEGSRIALARVKAYWAEMDATTVAAQEAVWLPNTISRKFSRVLV